jgi:ADP-heptose:LPS heptosyltransferase
MRVLAPLFQFLSRPSRRRAGLVRQEFPAAQEFKTVLIAIPGALGDMVIALPVLLAAQQLFMEAEVEVLVHPDMRPFFQRFLNNWHFTPWRPRWFPKQPGGRPLGTFRPKTARSEYSLIVDLRGELQSAFTLRSIRARRRIGIDEFGSSLFYHWAHLQQAGQSQQSQLLAPFQLFQGDLRPVYPVFAPEASPLKSSPVLGIAPGAGCQSKRWPLEKFQKLIHSFKSEWPEGRVRLLGSQADRQLSLKGADEDWRGKRQPSDAVEDLEELAVFVGNDSFYGHLAALLAVPSMILFSAANDLERWRPRGPDPQTLLALCKTPDCAGCRQRSCSHRTCLEEIAVEEVLNKVRSLLVCNGPNPVRDHED